MNLWPKHFPNSRFIIPNHCNIWLLCCVSNIEHMYMSCILYMLGLKANRIVLALAWWLDLPKFTTAALFSCALCESEMFLDCMHSKVKYTEKLKIPWRLLRKTDIHMTISAICGRKPSPDFHHNVETTQLYIMSFYAAALRFSVTGTKGPKHVPAWQCSVYKARSTKAVCKGCWGRTQALTSTPLRIRIFTLTSVPE